MWSALHLSLSSIRNHIINSRFLQLYECLYSYIRSRSHWIGPSTLALSNLRQLYWHRCAWRVSPSKSNGPLHSFQFYQFAFDGEYDHNSRWTICCQTVILFSFDRVWNCFGNWWDLWEDKHLNSVVWLRRATHTRIVVFSIDWGDGSFTKWQQCGEPHNFLLLPAQVYLRQVPWASWVLRIVWGDNWGSSLRGNTFRPIRLENCIWCKKPARNLPHLGALRDYHKSRLRSRWTVIFSF